VLHHLRQQSEKQGPQLLPGGLVAPKESGKPDWIGAFAVTGGIGEEAIAKATRRPRRLQRHSHSGGATAWPRPLPNTCTAGAQSALGLCPGRGAQQRRADPRKLPGHTPGAGLPGLPGAHREGSIWELLDVEQAIGMQLTESYAMWPGRRCPAGTSPTPTAILLPWPRSSRIRWKTTPRKGMTLAEAERWLGPNLH
jgi:5-methyltetrahydrofolate--homocysteine methyltransferase